MLNPIKKKGICLTFKDITRIKEENVGWWRNLYQIEGGRIPIGRWRNRRKVPWKWKRQNFNFTQAILWNMHNYKRRFS